MKPFKHLESGMSFIEVVLAIGILAIFGSSLFMMQAYLFNRIAFAEKALVAQLQMKTELIAYRLDILKELFAFKGPVTKSLQTKTKEFFNPDMLVTITTRSDFKETKFKSFQDLYLIATKAENSDMLYGSSYTFVYIPKVPKK